MMRIVVMGALAFVLGLGGGTGVTVLQSRGADAGTDLSDAPAVVDSLPESEGDVAGDEPMVEADSLLDEGALPEDAVDSTGAAAVSAGAVDGSTNAPGAGGGAAPLESTPEQDGAGMDGGAPIDAVDGGLQSPTPGAAPTPASPVAQESTEEGIRRMARIFAAMKPREAAAVMERMTDDEVRGVLLQLGDRPAAAILAVFDPDRAAELSRVVLGRRGGS